MDLCNENYVRHVYIQARCDAIWSQFGLKRLYA